MSSKIIEHLTLFKQKMNKTRVDVYIVDIQLNMKVCVREREIEKR